MNSSDSLLGQTLAGRYRIVQDLGGGGFANTYLAEDQYLFGSARCVVKELKATFTTPDTLKSAERLFAQEAIALHRLGDHDQIPRLLAYFEEASRFYLVEESIEGVSLAAELMAGHPWSEWYVLQLLQDLLDVLSFVHYFQRGYIHRDVKPSNIIRRKVDGKCVLIDFGSVKQITQQVMQTQTMITPTVIVGTLGYMPCEQLQGRPRKSSDVYAVGMIALYALTGQNPAITPFAHDPNTGRIHWRDRTTVSRELANIIDQMVAHDFRQRYPSAQEALIAVQELIQVRQHSEQTVVRSNSLESKATSDGIVQQTSPLLEINPAQTTHQNATDFSSDTVLENLSWRQILNHFTSLIGLHLFQLIQKGTTPKNLAKIKLTAKFSLPILILAAMFASPHLEWLCRPLDNCSLEVKSRNIFDLPSLQKH